jgi:archaellum component FlaC
MKNLWEKIDNKLDKLDERLDSVDKTLVKQEANLAEHMRRTELLEKQHENFANQLTPIKNHVEQVKTSVKILAFILPIITSIIYAYFKIN